MVTRCFPLPPPSMEKASGVREARSSRDEGAGAEEGRGGLTQGTTSGAAWWLVTGGEDGEVVSMPLGGVGSAGDESGGLKEEGRSWRLWMSPRGSRRGKRGAGCSSRLKGPASIDRSVALGGRMLSLAMVAWMELMGMSPPRTMSCWASCLEYGCRERAVRRWFQGNKGRRKKKRGGGVKLVLRLPWTPTLLDSHLGGCRAALAARSRRDAVSLENLLCMLQHRLVAELQVELQTETGRHYSSAFQNGSSHRH